MDPGVQGSLLHDAFISYSRRDKVFATKLEKALEAYTPPNDLKVPQCHLDIFRDVMEDFTGTEEGTACHRKKHVNINTDAPRSGRN